MEPSKINSHLVWNLRSKKIIRVIKAKWKEKKNKQYEMRMGRKEWKIKG